MKTYKKLNIQFLDGPITATWYFMISDNKVLAVKSESYREHYTIMPVNLDDNREWLESKHIQDSNEIEFYQVWNKVENLFF